MGNEQIHMGSHRRGPCRPAGWSGSMSGWLETMSVQQGRRQRGVTDIHTIHLIIVRVDSCL